jgi:hypothetical protein
MKRSMHVVSSLLTFLAFAVSTGQSYADERMGQSSPNDYLRLKGSAKFNSAPYVWERTYGKKHIVVIGTFHLLDPQAPMYRRMAAIFERVQPQFILHESTAPDDLATETREQAIRRGADLGFTVELARQSGVPTESADASPREEMKELLARHSADEVFVYLVATRLIGSYRNPDLKEAASEYPAFFDSQIVGNGIPVKKEWGSWAGFLSEYRRVARRSLTAKTWDPQLLDPTQNMGRLNAVARTSDTLRDRYLIAAIRRSLQKYDRVIVVFGSAHVVAIEPMLEKQLGTIGTIHEPAPSA